MNTQTERTPDLLPNMQGSHTTVTVVDQAPSGFSAQSSSLPANVNETNSTHFQPEDCKGQLSGSIHIPDESSTYVHRSVSHISPLHDDNIDEIDQIVFSDMYPKKYPEAAAGGKHNLDNMLTETDIIFGLENDAIITKLNEQQNHLDRNNEELSAIEAEYEKLSENMTKAVQRLRDAENKPEILEGFLETHKHAIVHCNGDFGKALTVMRSLLPRTSVENEPKQE